MAVMENCPSVKWFMVGGKKKTRRQIAGKRMLDGDLRVANQMMKLTSIILKKNQILAAAGSLTNPSGENTPIAIGSHTAGNSGFKPDVLYGLLPWISRCAGPQSSLKKSVLD